MIPAMINLLKVETMTVDVPSAEEGLLFMIFPNIKKHYGEGEKYKVAIDVNDA